MEYLLLQDYGTSLFLHIVRAGAFLAVLPLFGQQRDSFFLRLVLATSLGAIFWWVGQQRVETPDKLLELGVMGVREGFIGIALGFGLSTMTTLLISAGEIISMEMGFSMARAINPETGVSATVVSQLLQTLGFLLLLQLDLHHEVLRVLEHTFRACPVGETFDLMPIFDGIVTLVAGSVELAIHYAFPIIGTMMLISTGMVLLGRAVPAINLMEFGFALRIVAALGAMTLYLGEGAPFLINMFESVIEQVYAMFPG